MATKASAANPAANVSKISATNCTQGNELTLTVIYIYIHTCTISDFYFTEIN